MADAVHTYLEDAFQRFLEKPVGATLAHSVQAQDDGDAILRRRSAVGKVAILAATPAGEEFLGGARSAPLSRSPLASSHCRLRYHACALTPFATALPSSSPSLPFPSAYPFPSAPRLAATQVNEFPYGRAALIIIESYIPNEKRKIKFECIH